MRDRLGSERGELLTRVRTRALTLPPTDEQSPLGSTGGGTGILMVLVLLAGVAGATPILVFGKRRQGIRR